MRSSTRLLLLPLLGAFLVAGCATTREAKWNETATETKAVNPGAQDRAAQLEAEGDALWAERAEREKLKAALAKWEEAAKQAPGNGELFVKLSRGYYLLAEYSALDGDVEKRDAHYTTGLDWAERALAVQAPDFVAAKQGGEKHAEAVRKAPREAIPALYWWATNLGKWASSKGLLTLLKYKDDVKATIEHIATTDEGFFYGAAHRYLGAYHARAPGGSLEDSEKHFRKAVELAPGYLGTKVLWADYLCTKKRDRAMYKKLLEEVVNADPAAVPEIEPENRLEQEKAKKLLAEIDDLFGPEGSS